MVSFSFSLSPARQVTYDRMGAPVEGEPSSLAGFTN
jgi:hypothetical protein